MWWLCSALSTELCAATVQYWFHHCWWWWQTAAAAEATAAAVVTRLFAGQAKANQLYASYYKAPDIPSTTVRKPPILLQATKRRLAQRART